MSAGRISDQSRYLGLVPQYNALLSKQLEKQREIASGKKYERADENPLAVSLADRFHTEDARLQQNLGNIDEVNAFAQTTDTAISSATDTIQRANELAIRGNDGALSNSDRENIAAEVDQLLKGLIDLGGQAHRGRFVFSGTKTTTAAFQAVTDGTGKVTAVTYNGNSESMAIEFAPQQNIDYNMLGSNELGGSFGLLRDTTAGVDLFQNLIDLRDNLTNNPTAIDASVTALQAALSHLTTAAAQVGGTEVRMNSAAKLHQDQQELLASTASKLEDTDIASAISELTILQTSYQAALNVGARVNQVSLLDFLR